LGLHQSAWERIDRPAGLEEVGYLESKEFQPTKWKPLDPNATFANLTDRDGYWAAKIVSAFTDADIDAAVAAGQYKNPDATTYVARMLRERRDKIARHWFDRVAPLDFFTTDGGTLRLHDLGAERSVYPGTTARYRFRIAAVRPDRGGGRWSDWEERPEPSFNLAAAEGRDPVRTASAADRPFFAVEAQVTRGGGWSPSVTVFIARASGRVVSLSR
ncbi:MAG: hypothetical protein ACRENN_10695, partial [Candidatus Eiseniibacteriota bacterium]